MIAEQATRELEQVREALTLWGRITQEADWLQRGANGDRGLFDAIVEAVEKTPSALLVLMPGGHREAEDAEGLDAQRRAVNDAALREQKEADDA